MNQPEDIQSSFEPYFTDAFLETATNPNLVWDVATKLDMARIYDQSDIDAVVNAWVLGKGNQALDSAFAPAITRYTTPRDTAISADDKAEVTRSRSSARTSAHSSVSTTS